MFSLAFSSSFFVLFNGILWKPISIPSSSSSGCSAVLSMSISDEDTDAGSDFIELQPVSEYEESKENKELGIDLTPNVDDGYVPLHNEEEEEEEEEVLMPPEDDGFIPK
jgi:hypothetical protein